MKLDTLLLLVGLNLVTPLSSASESHTTVYDASTVEMNGIRFSDYANFDQWKLVTTRFRRDSGELRFVYANLTAWESLKSGKEYADGSVFAKAAFQSEEDPRFASSLEPSGSLRVQLMVRDKKKYASTQGWGYAIFQSSEPPGETRERPTACAACHQIVSDRGYIFSQPFGHSPFQEKPSYVSKGETAAAGLRFADVSDDTLKKSSSSAAKQIRRFVIGKFQTYRSLEGELREKTFPGTSYEIVPALLKEAKSSGHPAIFWAKEKKFFALAQLLPVHQNNCSGGLKAMHAVFNYRSPYFGKTLNVFNEQAVETLDLCY